jgi:glycosyltransferase involved in cell wall biosynthesis
MASPDIWSDFRGGMKLDQASAWRSACLEVLRISGLFSADTYLSRRGALPAGADPLADYHDHGWRCGHWPNAYFDPAWYAASNADVAGAGTDPLLHYVSYGEREGRRPVAWFDPAWYRARHPVPDDMHCLRHFLLHRRDGSASPIAEFDSGWYLVRYPDVADAGMDPMEHYLVQGFREDRNPSAGFDTRFYRLRYLRRQPEENPLLHYLRHRDEPGIHPCLPGDETTVARELRRCAGPGPAFEPVRALPADALPRALVLAFYLPQFHPIAENDRWWGEGFTEWTNIGRGLPRFAGHYQPRIPRDLGHYRLDDPAVLPRQVALAQGAGIGGFVFYFYWFDGKRLLERPLERFLADRSIDFPFCLMWANENWSRRWDGSDDEVLIAQSYAEADEAALIACFARHFADPRYIRLQGRPVLMVYRAALIPDTLATVARWRARFRAAHGENPVLVMAQSFDDEDPRDFGLDAAVEFPPHKLVHGLRRTNLALDLLDHEFDAQVYAYDDAVAAACDAVAPDYTLIRCAMPGWDNDARRQGHGMVMHGATPARYQAWLDHLIGEAQARPAFGTPVVCINAWNEWAEAAYLEPDQHFGAAFLNATGRAIAGVDVADGAGRLVLVGHDAFAAGAQLLLLNIARRLRAAHGMRLEIVLCGGGALEAAYRAVAPVHIVRDPGELSAQLGRLRQLGVRHALVNSAASARCCAGLAAHGIAATLLVHEMPVLLAQRGLVEPLREALGTVRTVVFAAAGVRDAVAGVVALDPARSVILPQGVYRGIAAEPEPAARLRDGWGIGTRDLLAVGVGYGDLRKGFDLFLQVWRQADRPGLHMIWVGEIDAGLRTWLAPEIAVAEASGRFRLTGWRDDIAAILTAADAFLLTSREDPYPSAALEALGVGTRVIAFDGSGGIADLLRGAVDGSAGQVVPMADCAGMAAALRNAVRETGHAGRLPPGHGFGAYVAELLRLTRPGQPRVSVIVPCYRQAGLLPRRLATIFGQTVPLHELVLRDDASDDGSAAAAVAFAQDAGRELAVVRAARNSGSPFGCWRDAVARTSGELVWIAEADDASEPGFLSRLLPAFEAPDVLFAFCDSRPIDRDGNARPEQYRVSYEAVGGAGALPPDQVYDAAGFAREFLAERNILFNVSAVLWRRSALLTALERLGDELLSWRVAGDWRLYVEVLGSQAGRVAHVAQPLNLHCRDPQSASARLPVKQHLAEIRRMQALIRRRVGDAPGLALRQRRFLQEAAAHLRGVAA